MIPEGVREWGILRQIIKYTCKGRGVFTSGKLVRTIWARSSPFVACCSRAFTRSASAFTAKINSLVPTVSIIPRSIFSRSEWCVRSARTQRHGISFVSSWNYLWFLETGYLIVLSTKTKRYQLRSLYLISTLDVEVQREDIACRAQ